MARLTLPCKWWDGGGMAVVVVGVVEEGRGERSIKHTVSQPIIQIQINLMTDYLPARQLAPRVVACVPVKVVLATRVVLVRPTVECIAALKWWQSTGLVQRQDVRKT